MVHGDSFDVGLSPKQCIDELYVAVPTQTKNVRYLLLNQIVDDDFGAVEHIGRHHVILHT